MVKSRINKKMKYPENKELEVADEDLNATLWDLDIFKIPILIALGHLKEKKNIGYFPIYIIINSRVNSQIGIFEFEYSKFDDIMDEDGDPDLEQLDSPLYYKFVNKKYIQKLKEQQDVSSDDEGEDILPDDDEEEGGEAGEEGEEGENDNGNSLPDEGNNALPGEGNNALPGKGGDALPGDDGNSLPDGQNILDYDKKTGRFCDNTQDNDESYETNKDHKSEQDKFSSARARNWIQRWTQRQEFSIIETNPNGDCFFEAVQKAFNTLNITITINKLREMLANEVTADVLETFKALGYDIFQKTINENKKKRGQNKKKAKENHELYQRSKGDGHKSRNSALLQRLASENKTLAEDNKKLQKEVDDAILLQTEFMWMKGVETVDDMKAKILTTSYWVEDWGISKMEKILNVKFIIVDKRAWEGDRGDEDTANILLCGRGDDNIKTFNPKYYIILNRTGDNHYKLVEWKGLAMLTFKEIPCVLRNKIVDKCLEHNSGLFYLIPKFAKLKESVVFRDAPKIPLMGDQDETVPFSEETIFQFYSRSADTAPGKGSGEKISANDLSSQKYKNLRKIKNWRRILSNFAQTPFKLDGLNWNGVEWYYQASKYKKNNTFFSREFSIESDSEISKDAVIAKIAGGQNGFTHKRVTITDDATGKTKKKREKIVYREPDISIDPDFFPMNRNQVEMETALRAKFTQNELARNVLLETCGDGSGLPAKLQHYIRGKSPEVWYILMKIRQEIKRGSELGGDEGAAAAAAAVTPSAAPSAAAASAVSEQVATAGKKTSGTKFNMKTGTYN